MTNLIVDLLQQSLIFWFCQHPSYTEHHDEQNEWTTHLMILEYEAKIHGWRPFEFFRFRGWFNHLLSILFLLELDNLGCQLLHPCYGILFLL